MKISVYITSYNQKAFLKEAIESVLAQTLKPFEIIIVDDFSTDGSQDLIREYAEEFPAIKYFLHKENRGVTQVRITALSNVKGDFVTYLDGDDLYLPNKLKIESNLIKLHKSDIAFSNNMYVTAHDTNDIKWIWAADKFQLDSNLFAKTISRNFPRKSLFRMELINYKFLKDIGFHDVNLKIYEDYELRIRLAKLAKMSCSIEPTTKIRISENGLSKSAVEEHIKAFKYIYAKYEADVNDLDNPLKSQVLTMMKENFDVFKEHSDQSDNSKQKYRGKFQRFLAKF